MSSIDLSTLLNGLTPIAPGAASLGREDGESTDDSSFAEILAQVGSTLPPQAQSSVPPQAASPLDSLEGESATPKRVDPFVPVASPALSQPRANAAPTPLMKSSALPGPFSGFVIHRDGMDRLTAPVNAEAESLAPAPSETLGSDNAPNRENATALSSPEFQSSEPLQIPSLNSFGPLPVSLPSQDPSQVAMRLTVPAGGQQAVSSLTPRPEEAAVARPRVDTRSPDQVIAKPKPLIEKASGRELPPVASLQADSPLATPSAEPKVLVKPVDAAQIVSILPLTPTSKGATPEVNTSEVNVPTLPLPDLKAQATLPGSQEVPDSIAALLTPELRRIVGRSDADSAPNRGSLPQPLTQGSTIVQAQTPSLLSVASLQLSADQAEAVVPATALISPQALGASQSEATLQAAQTLPSTPVTLDAAAPSVATADKGQAEARPRTLEPALSGERSDRYATGLTASASTDTAPSVTSDSKGQVSQNQAAVSRPNAGEPLPTLVEPVIRQDTGQAEAALATLEGGASGEGLSPQTPPSGPSSNAAIGASSQPPPSMSRIGLETLASLAAQMSRRISAQSTRFDIALTPQDLGRVDVQVEIARDGRIRASMAFDSTVSAGEFRARGDELRRHLEDAGFRLSKEDLSFTSRDSGADSRGSGQGQSQQNASDRPHFRTAAFDQSAALSDPLNPVITSARSRTSALDVRV